jgi:hypothetical protein
MGSHSNSDDEKRSDDGRKYEKRIRGVEVAVTEVDTGEWIPCLPALAQKSSSVGAAGPVKLPPGVVRAESQIRP